MKMMEQRAPMYKRAKRYAYIGFALLAAVGTLSLCVCEDAEGYEESSSVTTSLSVTTYEDITEEPITSVQEPADTMEEPVESVEPVIASKIYSDPNNDIYPYALMSEDWGLDIYREGFTYYQIPEEYARNGGMFPEVAQAYLWGICQSEGVDYYMVLALIERESGYKYDALGDSGRSKGLMQIQERWHSGRMNALGAYDLYNPYSNMRVGVDFLAEIQAEYLESSGAHCVLMVYNMGIVGAKKLWAQGIYSTPYSRQIMQRALEIKQELLDT